MAALQLFLTIAARILDAAFLPKSCATLARISSSSLFGLLDETDHC